MKRITALLLCVVTVLSTFVFVSCKCKEGEHNYEETITENAACGKEGLKTFICSICGDTYTEKIPALKHKYEETKSTVTCTEAGVKSYECSLCKDTYEEKAEAAGHSWVDATCKEPKHCSVCGTADGDIIDHKYVNGICKMCEKPKPITLNMPTFPITASHYLDLGKYGMSLQASYSITDIVYEYSYPLLEVVLKVTKTYEKDGIDGYESGVGIMLYDSSGKKIQAAYEDEVIDAYSTTGIKTGETGTLKAIIMANNITPGGTYRIEIVSKYSGTSGISYIYTNG